MEVSAIFGSSVTDFPGSYCGHPPNITTSIRPGPRSMFVHECQHLDMIASLELTYNIMRMGRSLLRVGVNGVMANGVRTVTLGGHTP